jgi:RNA polymerase sigma-70 factor (ECF subfamily)
VPEASFRALIDEYSPAVLNTATRILQDSQMAQDVHQEVFLEIWRRWHKFDGRTNWAAYLYRTTVRKAMETAKKTTMERLDNEQVQRIPKNASPDGHLRAAELHGKVVDCLAELPERQAEVFVLARIEGLEHEKIARILGCSQETVRVHLHRALKRLAEKLKDFLEK